MVNPKIKNPKIKEPIQLFRIFCAECSKDMGIVKSIPVCFSAFEKLLDEKQSYEYIIEKSREEAYTVYYTRTFCSKDCKKKFVKRLEK